MGASGWGGRPGSAWPGGAEALLSGPAEIAVVGPPADPRTAQLQAVALRAPSPGAVLALGDGTEESAVPLLVGRGLVGGAPAAYVCRNFTCRAPVTDPVELAAALGGTSEVFPESYRRLACFPAWWGRRQELASNYAPRKGVLCAPGHASSSPASPRFSLAWPRW